MGNRHPLQRLKLKWLKARWLNGEGPLRASWKPAPLVNPKSTRLCEPVVDYILQAAIRAPSGDNCQPWRFRVDQNRISLYLKPEIDRSLFNVEQYASLIACGAAVENMCLAASRYGFEARVSLFPHSPEPLRVADVDFEAADRAEDPLQSFIPDRHTNRTVYDGRAVSARILATLKAQCDGFPGVALDLMTDRKRLRQIARLVWQADRIRLENRHLHAHFMQMVRFSTNEALRLRDGLPLGNLEAGKGGEMFLRATRPWAAMNACNHLGASRLIARISFNGINQASAVGLVKCGDLTPDSFLRGGQALQRIWLAATREGLDFQPMTAITLFWLRWQLGRQDAFAAHQRRLLEIMWPAYERLLIGDDNAGQGHVMLFRIGYGRPVACRTLRRPIQNFTIA